MIKDRGRGYQTPTFRDVSLPTIVGIPIISKFLQKFPTISYFNEIPPKVSYIKDLPRIAQNCSL
jgi:hypothetical protein